MRRTPAEFCLKEASQLWYVKARHANEVRVALTVGGHPGPKVTVRCSRGHIVNRSQSHRLFCSLCRVVRGIRRRVALLAEVLRDESSIAFTDCADSRRGAIDKAN